MKLAPPTPAQQLGRIIENTSLEVELIRHLVGLADDLAGELSSENPTYFAHRRDQLCAVLSGCAAMLGDLSENIERAASRAYALPDGRRGSEATQMPEAA